MMMIGQDRDYIGVGEAVAVGCVPQLLNKQWFLGAKDGGLLRAAWKPGN